MIDIKKLIENSLSNLKVDKKPKIIAVSKTFSLDKIMPLIEYGHLDFGENKVQEALNKWSSLKSSNKNIKLHLIGGLQSNKVKFAVKLFDYIHSVDNEKLAKKIFDEQEKQKNKLRYLFRLILEMKNKSLELQKIYFQTYILFAKI